MKKILGIGLLMVLLSGCGLDVLMSSAIQGELQGRQAEEMTRQLQRQQATPTAGIPPSDLQTLEQIQQAINQYGMATGFFPTTLDDLVPQYLSTPPRTESGAQFIYNNQNGFLAHPAQHMPQPGAAPGAPPGTGLSPMGQYMTGAGVRESMPQQGGSALSRTGGYARENIHNTTDTYSDRQMEQIQELGF